VAMPRPSTNLSLSDLVICCGSPQPGDYAGTSPAVRLEANPGARVVSDQLVAYFEIYNLRPDAAGQSRFEYVYTVSSAAKDPRIWLKRLFQPRHGPEPLSASRESENPGAMRRQFVTVPVQTLPAGRYRFEVQVRDLSTGAEAVGQVEFVKLDAVALHE
jgi:hypothetical protein